MSKENSIQIIEPTKEEFQIMYDEQMRAYLREVKVLGKTRALENLRREYRRWEIDLQNEYINAVTMPYLIRLYKKLIEDIEAQT